MPKTTKNKNKNTTPKSKTKKYLESANKKSVTKPKKEQDKVENLFDQPFLGEIKKNILKKTKSFNSKKKETVKSKSKSPIDFFDETKRGVFIVPPETDILSRRELNQKIVVNTVPNQTSSYPTINENKLVELNNQPETKVLETKKDSFTTTIREKKLNPEDSQAFWYIFVGDRKYGFWKNHTWVWLGYFDQLQRWNYFKVIETVEVPQEHAAFIKQRPADIDFWRPLVGNPNYGFVQNNTWIWKGFFDKKLNWIPDPVRFTEEALGHTDSLVDEIEKKTISEQPYWEQENDIVVTVFNTKSLASSLENELLLENSSEEQPVIEEVKPRRNEVIFRNPVTKLHFEKEKFEFLNPVKETNETIPLIEIVKEEVKVESEVEAPVEIEPEAACEPETTIPEVETVFVYEDDLKGLDSNQTQAGNVPEVETVFVYEDDLKGLDSIIKDDQQHDEIAKHVEHLSQDYSKEIKDSAKADLSNISDDIDSVWKEFGSFTDETQKSVEEKSQVDEIILDANNDFINESLFRDEVVNNIDSQINETVSEQQFEPTYSVNEFQQEFSEPVVSDEKIKETNSDESVNTDLTALFSEKLVNEVLLTNEYVDVNAPFSTETEVKVSSELPKSELVDEITFINNDPKPQEGLEYKVDFLETEPKSLFDEKTTIVVESEPPFIQPDLSLELDSVNDVDKSLETKTTSVELNHEEIGNEFINLDVSEKEVQEQPTTQLETDSEFVLPTYQIVEDSFTESAETPNEFSSEQKDTLEFISQTQEVETSESNVPTVEQETKLFEHQDENNLFTPLPLDLTEIIESNALFDSKPDEKESSESELQPTFKEIKLDSTVEVPQESSQVEATFDTVQPEQTPQEAKFDSPVEIPQESSQAEFHAEQISDEIKLEEKTEAVFDHQQLENQSEETVVTPTEVTAFEPETIETQLEPSSEDQPSEPALDQNHPEIVTAEVEQIFDGTKLEDLKLEEASFDNVENNEVQPKETEAEITFDETKELQQETSSEPLSTEELKSEATFDNVSEAASESVFEKPQLETQTEKILEEEPKSEPVDQLTTEASFDTVKHEAVFDKNQTQTEGLEEPQVSSEAEVVDQTTTDTVGEPEAVFDVQPEKTTEVKFDDVENQQKVISEPQVEQQPGEAVFEPSAEAKFDSPVESVQDSQPEPVLEEVQTQPEIQPVESQPEATFDTVQPEQTPQEAKFDSPVETVEQPEFSSEPTQQHVESEASFDEPNYDFDEPNYDFDQPSYDSDLQPSEPQYDVDEPNYDFDEPNYEIESKPSEPQFEPQVEQQPGEAVFEPSAEAKFDSPVESVQDSQPEPLLEEVQTQPEIQPVESQPEATFDTVQPEQTPQEAKFDSPVETVEQPEFSSEPTQQHVESEASFDEPNYDFDEPNYDFDQPSYDSDLQPSELQYDVDEPNYDFDEPNYEIESKPSEPQFEPQVEQQPGEAVFEPSAEAKFDSPVESVQDSQPEPLLEEVQTQPEIQPVESQPEATFDTVQPEQTPQEAKFDSPVETVQEPQVSSEPEVVVQPNFEERKPETVLEEPQADEIQPEASEEESLDWELLVGNNSYGHYEPDGEWVWAGFFGDDQKWNKDATVKWARERDYLPLIGDEVYGRYNNKGEWIWYGFYDESGDWVLVDGQWKNRQPRINEAPKFWEKLIGNEEYGYYEDNEWNWYDGEFDSEGNWLVFQSEETENLNEDITKDIPALEGYDIDSIDADEWLSQFSADDAKDVFGSNDKK
ncbi:EAGR box-containing protein [Mycoplasmoides genitalium]